MGVEAAGPHISRAYVEVHARCSGRGEQGEEPLHGATAGADALDARQQIDVQMGGVAMEHVVSRDVALPEKLGESLVSCSGVGLWRWVALANERPPLALCSFLELASVGGGGGVPRATGDVRQHDPAD